MKSKKRIHNEDGWLHGTRSHQLRANALRLLVYVLGLVGMTAIYYVGFSLLFDTPVEYEMKRSTRRLAQEYRQLNRRYDTLQEVLANVIERDKYVFRTLFESEPYDLDAQAAERLEAREKLLTQSNRQMGDALLARSAAMEERMRQVEQRYLSVQDSAAAMGDRVLYIPAIQPVINNSFTLLASSYGMRIHPFYKTLVSHQGVDYSVPEGSRVFATADGVVREVSRRSSSGLSVLIDHGNGYQTLYAHLSEANVERGQRVRRGDIIAASGNTGLSLAPHLHYEVIHNGMRVDPIHYFFAELSPNDYRKMIRIAQSGMQSFD